MRAFAALLVALLVAAPSAGREALAAKRLLVAAAHPLAAEAGYAILSRGGSAVDAAIAVQLVLGLVEPQSSGIGGGAFLLHWSQAERRLRSYDGRETAPAAARADRFEGMGFEQAAIGGRSVGVPGVPRMLELAHARHGRLPWKELFSPAIALAEGGFPLSPRLHALLQQERHLPKDPQAYAIYYGKRVGERVTNPAYAATLRSIAERGADAFYEGEIAVDVARAAQAHGGDLTTADLAEYRPREREPVCGTYRMRRVCSMGPPSSGGIAVLQILGLLERVPFAAAPPQSELAVHYFSEAARLAYADRDRYLGDPDFVSVPTAQLLDARYLERRARLIGERSRGQRLPGDFEKGTSHFSIVEANGDAVAMTSTIEAPFGSRVFVRGFLLNNELTDFDFEPGGANEVGARKRPRSSMAPTMVFRAGELELLVGSPGGSAIINYVAKALVGVLDWGLDIQRAIELPNFGSRGGALEIERGTRYEALAPALERRGHEVELRALQSGLHGIERIPGGWRGGADPRREGVARGD